MTKNISKVVEKIYVYEMKNGKVCIGGCACYLNQDLKEIKLCEGYKFDNKEEYNLLKNLVLLCSRSEPFVIKIKDIKDKYIIRFEKD